MMVNAVAPPWLLLLRSLTLTTSSGASTADGITAAGPVLILLVLTRVLVLTLMLSRALSTWAALLLLRRR